MSDLNLTDNCFNPEGYWRLPIAKLLFIPCAEDLDLFDQNGYDLTVIEQHFASINLGHHGIPHREQHRTLKQDWFTQGYKIEGAVLNHSLLFERKGYADEALKQLEYWVKKLPLLQKIISIRPKWGLDFSMDYVDRLGNAFEILHWEWDGFEFDQVQERKLKYQDQLLHTDWDDAGRRLVQHKDQWHHLDFFAQSAWKCRYFNIENERFKMVIWE